MSKTYDNYEVNDSVTENGVTSLDLDKSEKAYNNAGVGANYDKFKVDNSSDTGEGRTENIDMNSEAKGKQFGQVKYAKRGGYESIYDDATRDTENDTEAYKRSMEPCGYDEESEEEGDGAGKGGKD